MTQAPSLTNKSEHISKNRKSKDEVAGKNVVVFEICAMGKGVKGRPVCVRSCLGPVEYKSHRHERASRSGSSLFASALLLLWHHFSQCVGASVGNRGDEGPDGRVGALIEQDRDECLEEENDNTEDPGAVDGQGLDEGSGPVEQQKEGAGDHSHDLEHRGLDDNCNEGCGGSRGLETTWVAQNRTNEIPEELAVEDAPVPCPNPIDAGRDGEETSPIVPNEVAHCWLIIVVRERVEGVCSDFLLFCTNKE